MHRETTPDDSETMSINRHQPDFMDKAGGRIVSGGLAGVYQNVKDIFPPRQTCQVLTKLIVLTGSTIPFTENLVHISVIATTWHFAVTVPE